MRNRNECQLGNHLQLVAKVANRFFWVEIKDRSAIRSPMAVIATKNGCRSAQIADRVDVLHTTAWNRFKANRDTNKSS